MLRLQINRSDLTIGQLERFLEILRNAGATGDTPITGLRQNDASLWLHVDLDVDDNEPPATPPNG